MMVFLAVNEWTIPVTSKSGSVRNSRVGRRAPALSGRPLVDERGRVRSWSFDCSPRTAEEAIALQGAINGWGDLVDFNSDLYTSRGVGPVSGDETIPLNYGRDNAGGLCVDALGNALSMFDSARACQPYTGLTNLLSAQQASPSSGTTGFANVGAASIALDTSRFVVRGSIVDTAMGVGDGWITDAVAASSATVYTGVVYVRISGDVTRIDVNLIDDVATVGTTKITVVPDDPNWYKIVVSGTTDGAATSIQMDITVGVGTGTMNMRSDCHAIYAATPRTDITPWRDNGASAVATDLLYDLSGYEWPHGFSFSCWAWSPVTGRSVLAYIADIRGTDSEGGVHRFTLYRPGSSDSQVMVAQSPESGSIGITGTNAWGDGAWHHVAMTWAPDDKLRMFFDGVEQGTATTFDLDMTKVTDFRIGHAAAAGQWEGYIDQAAIFPYRLHADQLAAHVAATYAMGRLPNVRLTGDFAPNSKSASITAVGEANDVTYEAVALAATFKTNARRLSFELHEDRSG